MRTKLILILALLAVVLLAGCAGLGGNATAATTVNVNGNEVVEQNFSYVSGNFTVPAMLCQPATIDNNTVGVVLTGGDGVTLARLQSVCEAFAGQDMVALAHDNLNGTILDNINAVDDALVYLQNKYPAMPRALWAHSSGTISTVFAAYEQPNITAFIDTSGHMQIPLCDQPGSPSPIGGSCVAYLTDFPAPILVVHGADDPTVNVSYALAFADRLKNLNLSYGLIVVPGAVHEFMTNYTRVLEDEAAFIRHEPFVNQTN